MGRGRVAVWAAVCVTLASCVSGGPRTGPPDTEQEARLEAATRPSRAVQIFFDWQMTDRDARFNGRGVLRMDAGYRARVDLFGPRGETLAAAIIDDTAMRVAPVGAAALLPPHAFLWSSVGVFRRPANVPLTGTTTADGRTTLDYRRDNTVWRFRFHGDRLESAEWTDGTGRRSVELAAGTNPGVPGRGTFRDWTAFRELTLEVTQIEQRTAGFESDVWILPGEN